MQLNLIHKLSTVSFPIKRRFLAITIVLLFFISVAALPKVTEASLGTITINSDGTWTPPEMEHFRVGHIIKDGVSFAGPDYGFASNLNTNIYTTACPNISTPGPYPTCTPTEIGLYEFYIYDYYGGHMWADGILEDGDYYYMSFYFDGSTFTPNLEEGEADDTRIIQITPLNNAVIATSSVRNFIEGATTTISVTYNINADDNGLFTGISVFINNVDQNILYGLSAASEYTFLETCQTNFVDVDCSTGTHTYTRDIWLPKGNYAIHARLQGNFLGVINPLTSSKLLISESQDDSNPVAQYHYYIVGEGTLIGNLRQDAGNQLEAILSGTSTASGATVNDCSVMDFHFAKCITFSLIPSHKQMADFGTEVSTGIFSKFPLGYVWNFYQLLLAEEATSLPVIDATIPNGVAGAGAHIDLAITPTTLNYLWNATTSQFTNESAPSTATFFEIVSSYWNIIIYMSLGLYLLRRILGSHVIGQLWSEEESGIRGQMERFRNRGGGKDIRNIKINDYSNYSEDEWQSAKNNRLL